MLAFLLTPLTQRILKKPENMGMLFEPIGMCATSVFKSQEKNDTP